MLLPRTNSINGPSGAAPPSAAEGDDDSDPMAAIEAMLESSRAERKAAVLFQGLIRKREAQKKVR